MVKRLWRLALGSYAFWALFIRAVISKDSFALDDTNNDAPYKVFRIFPHNWAEVQSLRDLRNFVDENGVDFWLESHQPGAFADVMVSPQFLTQFVNFVNSRHLNYTVTIEDVQRLIYVNEFEPEILRSWKKNDPFLQSAKNVSTKYSPLISKSRNFKDLGATDSELQSFLRRRLKSEGTTAEFEGNGRSFEKVGELRANYPFGDYTNYAAMLRFMRTLDFYYPHLVQLVQIGKTHEGRSIEGLRIGYPASNSTEKRIFWIDGNIHAREWASSHTALFIINQLISGYGKDPEITHYLNKLNFIIVPCVNPDGFEYSRSSLNPQIRLWRKNRSPEQCAESQWGGWRCCQGVDLNRNFDFHFGETGSSPNPCSNLYAGQKAFSEPEARAISTFLQSQEYANKIDGFITLHTYAQMWIHPFSHEVQYYPNDVAKIKRVAEKATERLRQVYGTQYRVGTGADMLAPASGGSDDWAKETLGARYVYLVELRPKLELSNGFILKQEELIPTAVETFEAIKTVIDAVLEDNGLTRKSKTSPPIEFSQFTVSPKMTRPSPPSLTNGIKSMPTMMGARGLLQIHPMVLEELKKHEHFDIAHNLQQQKNEPPRKDETIGAGGGQVFSKINLSVSQNIAFSGDESVQPRPAKDRSESPISLITTISPTTTQWSRKSSSPVTTKSTSTRTSSTLPSTTTPTTTKRETPTTTVIPTEKAADPSTTTTTAAEPFVGNSLVFRETIFSSTTESISTTVPSTLSPTLTANSKASAIVSSLSSPTTLKIVSSTPTTISSTTSRRRLPPTLITVSGTEIREEFVLTTTKSPTRQFVLRFLTSAPLSSSPKPHKNDTNFDSPLKLEVPPIIPEKITTKIASTTSPSSSSSSPHIADDEKCVDKKYSCTFWIKAHRAVCTEQKRFMTHNCAFSCGFCSTNAAD